MALTLEQEKALLALLQEKRTTLPELSAATELTGSDLFLTSQMLADKSVTADVMKQFIAPDATLVRKGLVQLNNNTGGNDELSAVTPKAVNQAIQTHANSRQHPDATSTQKGLVQLNSQINSDSETQAATPKAVKQAYDLANSKVTSVNGKTGSINLNANDVNALALENAPNFVILYPEGSEFEPAIIKANQRIIVSNPFHDSPVICMAEVLANDIWATAPWVFANNQNTSGVTASQINAIGDIVVRAGSQSVLTYGPHNGSAHESTTWYSEIHWRLKVWKVVA